jgi:hypothetical protein
VGALSSSPPEPAKTSRWKTPLTLTFAFSSAVLAVVASIAQLGVFPTRIARASLIAVGLTGLLYLVIKVWQLYFVEKVRELRAQLAGEAETLTNVRSAHQRCLEAIERISDREKPLFSETLEVTVCIGSDDDSDLIIEERVTSPEPLVTNRTVRPIVPTYREQIASLETISFTVHRADGEITFIPLREQINRLKVWLVFDPAMSSKTEWRMEYRPKGLWRPLRERGFDQLGWDDRLQTTDGTPSAFTSFTAVFKFPAGDQPPSVKERRGQGTLTEPVQKPDRTWEVIWRDEHPAGRRYDWDLTQPLRGNQKS